MDERAFRDAMGKFTTGITIVSLKDKSGNRLGMTVNAFMSISLQPQLIAISIGENASMHPQLLETKTLGISILSEEQKVISMIFSKQKEKDREIPFIDIDGTPVIEDSLATLTCTVKKSIKAGDHTIFIAEVDHLNVNEGNPILYFGGNYRTIEKE